MSREALLGVWWMGEGAEGPALEACGDARRAADAIGSRLGALLVGASEEDARALITHGADHVARVTVPGTGWDAGPETRIQAARRVIGPHAPRLVFATGDCRGREWAARLAVRSGWMLLSPALMVQERRGAAEEAQLSVTVLDRSGRRARQVPVEAGQSAVLTLRPGVGEPVAADPAREGTIEHHEIEPAPEPLRQEQALAADPATVDIRFARRLVSGGRGLGGPEGFQLLEGFADKIGAGIAASRVAVDLGWIGHERQVGQTGRTVKPDLYIACGISGASHHVEGMREAKEVVAINIDPEAPIFQLAHLGLVADLHQVLQHADERLPS